MPAEFGGNVYNLTLWESSKGGHHSLMPICSACGLPGHQSVCSEALSQKLSKKASKKANECSNYKKNSNKIIN